MPGGQAASRPGVDQDRATTKATLDPGSTRGGQSVLRCNHAGPMRNGSGGQNIDPGKEYGAVWFTH